MSPLLPDSLWQRVAPLLPPHPAHPRGGCDFKDDRVCLRGILFILKTGIQYQMLPTECFGVSGSTCWRRLRDWTAAGVWTRVHRLIVQELGERGALDLSVAIVDSASLRAQKGGATPAPAPSTDANAAANVN